LSLTNLNRPTRARLLKRRSVIAAATGLALSAVRGNEAVAQTLDDLPDAAGALQRFAPVPAPNLTFTGRNGESLSLNNYRGHGLVVSIWATWCGPCVAELPSLAAIAPHLAASKILVLPISIDIEGIKVVQPFYHAQNITNLPILLDPNGNDPDALNANGIPVTILITPTGHLIARTDGGANWNTPNTINLITQLISPPPANPVQPV
jgi:thiol-disulfide isomerase/thioredoxin